MKDLKESHQRRILLGLIIVFLPVFYAIVGVFFNTLALWTEELDVVLDASFFSTIAGLSLAAAAFLFSPIEQALQEIERLKRSQREIENDAWERAGNGAQEEPRQVQYTSKEKEIFNTLRLLIVSNESKLTHYETAKDYFLFSFQLFVVGLAGALSLDLWAEAGERLAGSDSPPMEELLAFIQSNALTFLDTGFALVTAGTGVIFLSIGAFYLGKGEVTQHGEGPPNPE